MRRSIAFAVTVTLALASVCCGSRRAQASSPHPEHSSSAAPSQLPAPVDVCIATDARRVVGTATPSYAGSYDPNVAPDPTLLNWMVPNHGCVTYPGPHAPRERCEAGGEALLPTVTPTLCQQ